MIENWSSADNRFTVHLSTDIQEAILGICKKSNGSETGGILLGKYTNNLSVAYIKEITAPSDDSIRSKRSFIRGISGLQKIIDYFWRGRKAYYLGEWHFHPYSSPMPSNTDILSIKNIADSTDFNCPEPILLVVGGDPKQEFTCSVTVAVRGGGILQLSPSRI